MVHFDRPSIPDQFDTVYESIMEENSPDKNKLSVHQKDNNNNKRTTPRSPRTPLSARSVISSVASSNPATSTKPKGKARIAHTEKRYNLLMDFNHQGQQNNNNRNVSQSQRSKIPADWLISPRPISSSESLAVGGCVGVPGLQVNKIIKKKRTKTEQAFNVSERIDSIFSSLSLKF